MLLNQTTNEDSVDSNWEKIQNNIIHAAKEAIGTRKVTTNNKQKQKSWFFGEVKNLTKEKRNA